MWQRWLTCAALMVAPVAATAPTANAAAVAVERFTIDEGTFVEPFAAGEGPCVPYAGTLSEDRIMTGTLRIFDSGANAGTFQVVFTVDAALTIAPDDATAGPRYSGTYVEHGTATGVPSWTVRTFPAPHTSSCARGCPAATGQCFTCHSAVCSCSATMAKCRSHTRQVRLSPDVTCRALGQGRQMRAAPSHRPEGSAPFSVSPPVHFPQVGAARPRRREMMPRMDVELLVVPDCPHGAAAAELVRRALDDAGLVDVPFRTTVVETEEEAQALGFIGSPTVRIEGVDPFRDPDRPAGLACRVYLTDGAPRGLPDLRALRRALKRHADRRATGEGSQGERGSIRPCTFLPT